jgi:cell division protein FtsW
MAVRLKTDWFLFATILVMVSFGILMVFSASSIMAQMDDRYGSSWYFMKRQAVFAVVSIIAMMVLKKTDYHRFNRPAVAFNAVGVALILLALAYFLDGAHHRWLRLGGPVGVQPSELAKPALVVFLAFFVSWRGKAINNPRHTLAPAAAAVGLVIVGVVVADLGTAVVLAATAAVVFIIAGLKVRYCAIAGAVALVGVAFAIYHEPYRLARVVHFFDPQLKIVDRLDKTGVIKARMKKSLTTRDTDYQVLMARLAVGAGGPVGAGLMNGKQKLLYLPEAHTDFIYAVVAEEVGLLGSMGLLIGFGIVCWRGLRSAWRMEDEFGRYLALGATVTIGVQALINMSVVLGLMPTKGIPLPMISYGGSSLLSTLALAGILMNVSEHAG